MMWFFSLCRQLTRVTLDPSALLILWRNTVGPAPTSHQPSGTEHAHIPEWMQVGTHLGLDAPRSPGRAPADTGPSPPAAPAAHHTVEAGYQPENPKPRALVSTTKLTLARKASLWARMGPDNRDSEGGKQNSECSKREADFYPFSRGSSWPRNRTRVSCIAGGLFTNWAIREVPQMQKQTCSYQQEEGTGEGQNRARE